MASGGKRAGDLFPERKQGALETTPWGPYAGPQGLHVGRYGPRGRDRPPAHRGHARRMKHSLRAPPAGLPATFNPLLAGGGNSTPDESLQLLPNEPLD